MNDELISQRRNLAEAIANARLTDAEHRKYSNLAQQYNGYMLTYISQGQDTQARQAADCRDECLSRSTSLQNSAKIQLQNVEALKLHLRQLEAKCGEANGRKQELLSKAFLAKSQEKMVSADQAFAQFERLERLIAVRSEKAIAFSEVNTRQITTMEMPALPAMPSIPSIPAIPAMPAMPEMPAMPSFNL
jgi:phage shock protein A